MIRQGFDVSLFVQVGSGETGTNFFRIDNPNPEALIPWDDCEDAGAEDFALEFSVKRG